MKSQSKLFWLGIGMVAASLLLVGCSSYPTKFGTLHGGHIEREHGKPMEGGYYQNFDPQAAILEVTPVEGTNPVQTQQVLIATVKDAQGKPLSGRRVEWIVEEGSAGSIIEVDESGWYNTRGYKLSNKYAISHTNQDAHVITRGNTDPDDDIYLEKGQTWCVITSPVEGTTHVVAYAPAIFDWDKHKVYVTKTWNDAAWIWPEPATNAVGTPHDMEVKVMQASNGAPITNSTVYFKLVSGPDGMFQPGDKKEVAVKTDETGTAKIRLVQAKPVEGVNEIEMWIIREQCGECNPPIKLAQGKTTKTWVGPRIAITKTAPATAKMNEQFSYQITVTNPGKAPATNAKLTDPLPDGIKYVSSAPNAQVSGNMLTWSLGTLNPGQSTSVKVVVQATRTGTFKNCATVNADMNLKAEACATTVVTSPELSLEKTGPDTVVLCDPITYRVTVKNSGDGPATNVRIVDDLPEGLKTEQGSTKVTADAGTLEAGQSKQITYTARASKPGVYKNTAVATADDGLKAQDDHQVTVTKPELSLTKTGPERRFVDRQAIFTLTVTNTGKVPAQDTVLMDTLPAGLTFVSASDGGTFAGGTVTWKLGTLPAGAKREVNVTVNAAQMGDFTNKATAQAYCADAAAQASLRVEGIPAILLEMVDLEDPIEKGKNETYVITVTNQGSAVGTGIQVVFYPNPGDKVVSATGATTGRVTDGKVVFDKLPTLAPKAEAVFRVLMAHGSAGQQRMRVELSSDQFTQPATETEITNVYE